MTPEDVAAGLLAGKTLIIDRNDNPLLPHLLDLVERGDVESEFVQHDEQSSAMKFWIAQARREDRG